MKTTGAGKSPATIDELRRAYAAGELTRTEVTRRAKVASLTLPSDFFAQNAAVSPIASAITAAQVFAPGAQGQPGTTTRQHALQRAATPISPTDTRAPKADAIPNPAPARINVSNKLHLQLVAQNDDMVAYTYFLKGKPAWFVAMRKYNPETALKLGRGMFAGQAGIVAFDRDGVFKDSTFLNGGDKQAAQDVMVADGLDAAAALNEAGIATVIATNQGSNKMSFEDKIAANIRVVQQIANAGGRVSLVIMCPYLDELDAPRAGDVDARKPGAGMLLFAKAQAEVDGVPILAMVGDQVTDVRAGQDAGLMAIQLTGPDGRAKDEVEVAKRKGETLPTVDRDPKRFLAKYGVAQAIAHLVASLPERPMTKHATRVAAPLATTEHTGALPDAWLHAVSAFMHRQAPMSSMYDLRVALHGADAEAAAAALGIADHFDARRELLLMNFTDESDLQANLYAFDVVRRTVRNIGFVDSGELDEVIDWDGETMPKRFERAVLLPVGPDAWDSGKRLAGFDDMATYTPQEPIDFTALEKRRGTDHRPVMFTLEAGLGKAPTDVGFYGIASADGGTSITITTGKVSHTIAAAPGTTFVRAGWSKRASVDAAILGVTDPRREGDGWREAEDALAASKFGSNSKRPLLWLEQSDGVPRFVALSVNQEVPAVLEVTTLPLTVKLHPAD